jgi:site-specific DNA-cytosine methylase
MDIRDLNVTKLLGSIDVILAGFPCQDLSYFQSVNRRPGLLGERSGLVREVFRLAKEAEVPIVFLENVPGVVQSAANTIVQEFAKNGYNVGQTIVSAAEVGAVHLRKRWFCMAVKPGRINMLELIANKSSGYTFTWNLPEPVPRLVPKMINRRIYNKLWKAIGNTVVPSSVQRAWDMLQKAHIGQLSDTILQSTDASLSHHIQLTKGTHSIFIFPKPDHSGERYTDIRLKVLSPTGSRQFLTKKLWATPMSTYQPVRNTFHPRTMEFLASMVMYEEDTIHRFKPRNGRTRDMPTLYDVNPHFLEWLMGYPKGWLISVS